MDFNFNSTQSFSAMDGDLNRCLERWHQELPNMVWRAANKHETPTLTVVANDSPLSIKVKEATAKHTYQWIDERTAMGPRELSKHYYLELKGKDDKGLGFIFKASMSCESEDNGKTWSVPSKQGSFSWLSRV